MSTSKRKQTATKKEQSESNEGHSGELHELFLDELADIYNGEQQLTKALPKMAKAAQSSELREAFESHLEETREQITRLDEAMKSIGESLKPKKCKGMEGLLEEGKDMMEEKEDSPTLDAAQIAAAQKVENCEIASYGSLSTAPELMVHE